MSIRTTVTLDEDVLERVKRESAARGMSFRKTLNELLRTALLKGESEKRRKPFRVRPASMGFRQGLDYDDVEGLLELGEVRAG